jgi:MoxR-like ATPase
MAMVKESDAADLPAQVEACGKDLRRLRDNIQKVFLGKPQVVELVLTGLLAEGHLLIEDVPGVGKTVLARSLARSLDVQFRRVQLTPDLLPSDILGVSVYSTKTGKFTFKPGPIFANIVLADEINRTTPRTQSALLEAMSEVQVTVDGVTHPLEPPFLVMATQNPFEFEGTYLLPENQLDRFTMRIRIGYPSIEHEQQILDSQRLGHPLAKLGPVLSGERIRQLQALSRHVKITEPLSQYILRVVAATRSREELRAGVSPRGALALYRAVQAAALLAGRAYGLPDDVKRLAIPVFAHRIVSKTYLQDGDLDTCEQIIADVLETVPTPD